MPEALAPDNTYPVEDIIALLDKVFPDDDPNLPVLGMTSSDEVAPNFTAMLTDPSTVIGTAERGGRLAGVSIAVPRTALGGDLQPWADKTAYIYFTAVEPALQGNGVVGDVMKSLLPQLKQHGYDYVERDCMVDNGYADKVEKIYDHALVHDETYDHDYWGLGFQRHLLIDLRLIEPEIVDTEANDVNSN